MFYVTVCERMFYVTVCERMFYVTVCERMFDVTVCERMFDVTVCERMFYVTVCERMFYVTVCERMFYVTVCERMFYVTVHVNKQFSTLQICTGKQWKIKKSITLIRTKSVKEEMSLNGPYKVTSGRPVPYRPTCMSRDLIARPITRPYVLLRHCIAAVQMRRACS
jgi:hypothetical protein